MVIAASQVWQQKDCSMRAWGVQFPISVSKQRLATCLFSLSRDCLEDFCPVHQLKQHKASSSSSSSKKTFQRSASS